ncbi:MULTISPECIES: chorismate mutase [Streptococcus]|uniref:chorismate mutase n=1 Tax=Streptococcus TaxID=1301 RepID=UPI0021B532CC|nr:chorismate mutase [Streptococcus mitis]
MDLDSIRQEIDQIDDQIVKLLEERMHLVEGVVAYKKASGKAILDTKREEAIFEKVRNRVEDKQYQETIVATFSDILKRSRDYQEEVKARD